MNRTYALAALTLLSASTAFAQTPRPTATLTPRPTATASGRPTTRPTSSARPPNSNNNNNGSPTPLVLDLGGHGDFKFKGAPVSFDIYADGNPVKVSWPGRGVAFLVLDRNGNGKVDDGSELFGDSTPLGEQVEGEERRTAVNGFAALAQYDDNDDGVVDAQDQIFQRLLLWIDADLDAVSNADELKPLSMFGITSLGTAYETIAGLGDQKDAPSLLLGQYHVNGKEEIRILADIYLERF